MSSFTPSGSGGLPSEATVTGATARFNDTVSMPLAATEYSYTFPVGTRQYLLRLRSAAELQVASISGQSGTNYSVVPRNNFLAESGLLLTSAVSIYFQSSQAGQVVELVYWT